MARAWVRVKARIEARVKARARASVCDAGKLLEAATLEAGLTLLPLPRP